MSLVAINLQNLIKFLSTFYIDLNVCTEKKVFVMAQVKGFYNYFITSSSCSHKILNKNENMDIFCKNTSLLVSEILKHP